MRILCNRFNPRELIRINNLFGGSMSFVNVANVTIILLLVYRGRKKVLPSIFR